MKGNTVVVSLAWSEITKCLTILINLLFIFYMPAAYGMLHPEDLQGEWKDSSGKRYEIHVTEGGERVILKIPFGQGQTKTYEGQYNPSSFQMTFAPQNASQLANDIPQKVKAQILKQGHVFTGQLKITGPTRLEFTERVDSVTYATADYAFKGIQKGPDFRSIHLQKPGAYTIKGVEVLLTHYQTRRDGEIRELREKATHVAMQELPELGKLLHGAVQRYHHRDSQMDALVKEREEKEQARKTLEMEIARIRNERPDGFRQLDDRRAALGKNIRTLEDTILANQGNPDFDSAKAFAGLDIMKAEMNALNRKIDQQYPEQQSLAEVEKLKHDIQNYFQELERLDTHIMGQSRLLNEEGQVLEGYQRQLDEKKAELAELEQQLANLINQPVPLILDVRLKAGDQQKFFARLYRDEAHVEYIKDEIADLERQLQENKKRDEELAELLREAEPAKQEAFDNFVALTEKTIQSGRELHSTLLLSMAGKASVETLAKVGELAWAAKEGGVFGAGKEAVVMFIQHQLGIDDGGFDMFDESALRTEILDGVPQAEGLLMAHGTDFAEAQITKTPFNLALGSLDHIHEVQKANVLKMKGLEQHLDNARRNAEQVGKAVEKQKERLADANRTLAGHRNKALQSLENGTLQDALSDHAQYDEARKNVSQARQKFERLAQVHEASKNRIKKNKKSIQKANQRIRELQTGTNNLKGAIKSLAPGLTADVAKGAANLALDNVEASAWRELFNNELAQRLAYIQYQRASNYYWYIHDLLEDIEKTDQEMQRMKAEKEYQLYSNIASIKAGGFHIMENKPFTSKEPLMLELNVISPHSSEGTYLESPAKNSQLKTIPGLTVPNAQAENQAGIEGASEGSQILRRYRMDASRLPLLLRDGGELNLVIIPL